MDRIDLLLYGLHFAFWVSFAVTCAILKRRGARASTVPDEFVVQEGKTASFSRALLVLHMVAFGVMYFGIAQAVLPDRVPDWFPGQRILGASVIILGAVLISWTMVFFRSWRFRARVDVGHELATGGPFAFLRHPIYMGFNLLALGSAIWAPTPITWIGLVLMAVGGDLRARGEEGLLKSVFGTAYTAYSARTKRFLPGIY